MTTRGIGSPISVSGRVGELHAPVPPYVPNVLKRFWTKARKYAAAFSKNLLKNRDEEFLKVTAKEFDEKGRHA